MQVTERLTNQLIGLPKGRLKWFFDFINLDIDSLGKLDAIILKYSLGLITGETYGINDYELEIWEDTLEDRNSAKEIQGLLKETMLKIMNCKKEIPPENPLFKEFLK